MMKFQEKLKKIGYNLKTKLGSGDNGIIYDIGKNKALKITRDHSEAATSAKVKGRNFKNVVQIVRVFKFNKVDSPYFIEQGKLSKIEIPFFSGSLNTDNFKKHFSFVQSNFDKIISFFPKDVKKKLLADKDTALLSVCFYFPDFSCKDFLNNHVNSLSELKIKNFSEAWRSHSGEMHKFAGLYNGLSELKSAGINFYDTHQQNAMKDKSGGWRWTDLGNNSEKIQSIETIAENETYNKNKK